jgi:hypothetical protein
VFLLHDVFGYPYAEIATILDKSEPGVRQLASRARRHVQQRRPRFQTTHEHRETLAARFFAAAEHGDLVGLEILLSHDVRITADGGGNVPTIRQPISGRSRVARRLIDWLSPDTALTGAFLRRVEINGSPGALWVDDHQRVLGVCALDFDEDQITQISVIANPDKLTHLGPIGNFTALVATRK